MNSSKSLKHRFLSLSDLRPWLTVRSPPRHPHLPPKISLRALHGEAVPGHPLSLPPPKSYSQSSASWAPVCHLLYTPLPPKGKQPTQRKRVMGRKERGELLLLLLKGLRFKNVSSPTLVGLGSSSLPGFSFLVCIMGILTHTHTCTHFGQS